MSWRHLPFLWLAALAALLPLAGRTADATLAENAARAQAVSPHVALLLPLANPALRAPAEAVRQGFAAAAARDGEAPPFRVHATTAEVEDILAAYARAVAAGARVVVGPLTRNGVTALAASGLVTVPTLSLAVPDHEGLALPPGFYLFGLSAEDEAGQVADMAWREGRRQPVLVVAETPLARRMHTAFVRRWQAAGGRPAGELSFSPGREAAVRGLAPPPGADMIFLAAGAVEARAVRPYLPANLPVYATSHAWGGHGQDPRNVDLNGVRFVDMPWLLAPDHPAVMAYPRPAPPFTVELERLYALGIDALRLASVLFRGPPAPGFTLDGVTGHITLGSDAVFRRQGLAAEFQQDTVVLVEEHRP